MCLKKLQETYDFSWPYVAHFLLSLSIPIYVEKTKHLNCLKDLEKYMTDNNLVFIGTSAMYVIEFSNTPFPETNLAPNFFPKYRRAQTFYF